MKKLLILLLCLAPVLAGLPRLYTQRREAEHLRLAETMGLDPAPEGLRLSLAAPGGGEEEPLFASAPGASVNLAMDAMRQQAGGEQLFFGHLQHILLGETYARQGLESLLSAVCRSSDLRLDMPVYLILGAEAGEAMAALDDGKAGVCDALNSLGQRKNAGLSSAGRILRDLDRQGSALIRALRLETSGDGDEERHSLVPAGCGVLADGRLRALLEPEEALAAELLAGELRPSLLLLRDGQGRRVTLELQEGRTRLEPVWDGDGKLAGLEIRAEVQAAVLEIEGFEQAADPRTLNEITARMEAELTRRIVRVLRLSGELEADFLGLGRRLELLSPLRGRGLGRDLGGLLPGLALRVTVRGELRHSNDMN